MGPVGLGRGTAGGRPQSFLLHSQGVTGAEGWRVEGYGGEGGGVGSPKAPGNFWGRGAGLRGVDRERGGRAKQNGKTGSEQENKRE